MTVTLTAEAQHRFDHYLQEVRLLLQGAPGIDAREVEGDVREHIETELGGTESPITEEQLENVLRKLGSPEGWVDKSEVPPWRRALARLYLGENWRLAYLCLGMTMLGVIFLLAGSVIALVFLGGGYLLARAAVSLADERGEKLGARRILVLTPIAVVVVPILIAILIGPLLPLAEGGYEEGWFSSLGIGPPSVDEVGREAILRTALGGVGLGAWWLGLAALWGLLDGALAKFARPLFVPRAAHRLWLGAIGLVLTVGGVVVLLFLAEARTAV